ncbi:microsomal glutathione S-transferase 1-like [Bradysia coprophila]|uniref:microsomal glutathione S-transferase 1-like n=1 Tax=Bradysia coprophila TaxID=38358 RepID=UPI00187DCE5B|nr:microsomal glutathione S-transferase 1-like [Bradysia coprophila]
MGTTTVIELLSFENAVFRAYIFWVSVLILKMAMMSALTGSQRKRKQVFANDEDYGFLNMDGKSKPSKFGDPDIERIRRAHRNDLENCIPFMISALLYVLTDPSQFLAINLIRAAVIARIVHTFVYAIYGTQPARGICFFVCYLITIYMSISTVLSFF